MSVSERRGSGSLKNIMQSECGQMRGDLRIQRIARLLAALFLGATMAVSPALAKHHDDDERHEEHGHHKHKHWHEYPPHVYAPPPVVYAPPALYPPPPPVVFAPSPSVNIVIPLPH